MDTSIDVALAIGTCFAALAGFCLVAATWRLVRETCRLAAAAEEAQRPRVVARLVWREKYGFVEIVNVGKSSAWNVNLEAPDLATAFLAQGDPHPIRATCLPPDDKRIIFVDEHRNHTTRHDNEHRANIKGEPPTWFGGRYPPCFEGEIAYDSAKQGGKRYVEEFSIDLRCNVWQGSIPNLESAALVEDVARKSSDSRSQGNRLGREVLSHIGCL